MQFQLSFQVTSTHRWTKLNKVEITCKSKLTQNFKVARFVYTVLTLGKFLKCINGFTHCKMCYTLLKKSSCFI